MTPLLQTRAMSIDYGGVHANKDVDLAVDEGRLVGLIGPNGAGKTSFVDAVSGFVRPSGGSVLFGGADVTTVPPHKRARLGMTRTFQSVELFDDLTVRENVLVASEPMRWWTPLADMVRPPGARGADADVEQALDQVGLAHTVDSLPTDLSHGQRKLVGVARALAMRPTMLLLDEPAAGLDSEESLALGEVLRRLVAGGLSILLIDHDMGLVLSVCDELYVLNFGQVIGRGTPTEIKSDPSVIAAYLGERAAEAQEERGDPIAAVQHQVATVREEL
ncbi:MAG: putative transporter ATP-binding protein [Conexibacter sp.]|nr:putative transporter ATP-binding protein [Conexibacter sp.]